MRRAPRRLTFGERARELVEALEVAQLLELEELVRRRRGARHVRVHEEEDREGAGPHAAPDGSRRPRGCSRLVCSWRHS